MLSLERLNILLHAYNQSKRIGLHSTTQPPVQNAATEIVGLLQRYKLQMSSLNNIGKKARDSKMYCTSRHIMASLQKRALVTKQKFASPLDFDPSYQAYWSENTRDTAFGASTNAFKTKFTNFSFCHPNYCDYLLHSLMGHALQSTKFTQEATATFLLLPDWLGWSKNEYMTWINDYPEHACVLAKFSADSMHLKTYRSLVRRSTPASAQQDFCLEQSRETSPEWT